MACSGIILPFFTSTLCVAARKLKIHRHFENSGVENLLKELHGRPKRKCEDNIKVALTEVSCVGERWKELAQESVQLYLCTNGAEILGSTIRVCLILGK
jgi:hypothetical protein